jgi:HD-GYP domain-containing protein (c-di-GMP phosphodiesterase class II)
VISRDITEKRKIEEEGLTHQQNLEEKVAQLTEELQDLFVSSMISLVNALEAKDPYTSGHSIRVCDISVKLAEYSLGISSDVKELELASKLHDIVKIGVKETVLNKSEGLTGEEIRHVQEHAVLGEKILMPIRKLKVVAEMVRHHHERFDGKGYPDGLERENIPACSRILSIADSYDAMISTRPYRAARGPESAAKEISKNLGTQFDPNFGGIFLELFNSGTLG